MNTSKRSSLLLFISAFLTFIATTSCNQKPKDIASDHPRLASGVIMRDVTFRSPSLGRDMQYRVFTPAAGHNALPVVYLLHGGGGNFRDWSNYSNVAEFAAAGLLLVMPEGDSSYYVNSASQAHERYEDYIISDLPADVEQRFPARSDRDSQAIVGVSMGGFGAVNLGLRHPDRFVFVGALSAAIDVPRRRFSWHRLEQSRRFERIFGPEGSDSRRERDPFTLVSAADPKTVPYFYLTCGRQEGLLPANREFAGLLKRHGIAYEFHDLPGAHEWNQWNRNLQGLFDTLRPFLKGHSIDRASTK